MRIVLVDTAYPDFIKSLYFNPANTYASELQAVLDQCFGTSDFWSRNLRTLGHDCIDIIANHAQLQGTWEREHGWIGTGSLQAIALEQIKTFGPDCVFLQDASFFDPATLQMLADRYLLALQCSCPWPGDALASKPAVVFTSFPHYVPRFKALGVPRVEYMPLAFEPRVVDRCFPNVFPAVPTEPIEMDFGRIHDVVFIGGVGAPSHWKYGMEVLETVAHEIPTFKWWGYGVETLPRDSALIDKYQGQAWGVDMYEILLQAKICITRHGEVAEGHTNNLRCFEVTGCGAMLQTEVSKNIGVLFPYGTVGLYSSPENLCGQLREYLRQDDLRTAIAKRGQVHTLANHTYAHRMKQVSEVLTECLEAKQMAH